jgi:hypothetical protein
MTDDSAALARELLAAELHDALCAAGADLTLALHALTPRAPETP